MIVAAHLPREAMMAHAGITPIATKNTGDPTNGRVPLRVTGEVFKEMTNPEFSNSKVRNFHRYASVDLVGSFDTEEQAASALAVAENQLRLNPAPGVRLTEPVDKAVIKRVFLSGFYRLGHVVTRWDAVSKSVINITTPDHEMRDGFVVRQVTALDRNIYVTTYGEGVNTSSLLAWANGTFGPNPFFDMDEHINDTLTSATGFRRVALPGVPGSVSAYDNRDMLMFLP